jgi:hypothetical protein
MAARDISNHARASNHYTLWPVNRRRTGKHNTFLSTIPTSPALAHLPLGTSTATRPQAQFRRDFIATPDALRQGRARKDRGVGGLAPALRGGTHRSRRAWPTLADRVLGRPREPREE